jgi:hypothetical protein
MFLLLCSGCEVERRKSDAELGLNAQQAAGRRVMTNIATVRFYSGLTL